jgi:hypothetical protein
MSRKRPGKIGSTLVCVEDGIKNLTFQQAALSNNKEDLEKLFALKFIELFNSTHPLGDHVEIGNPIQNNTSELDFSIDCPVATILEVAETTPLSEQFGQEAHISGELSVYRYSKWIWDGIIEKKTKKYLKQGRDIGNTILVLYATHWQFLPHPDLIDCLRSTTANFGCHFQSIFFLWSNGTDINYMDIIYPLRGNTMAPRHYRKRYYRNSDPTKQEDVQSHPINEAGQPMDGRVQTFAVQESWDKEH